MHGMLYYSRFFVFFLFIPAVTIQYFWEHEETYPLRTDSLTQFPLLFHMTTPLRDVVLSIELDMLIGVYLWTAQIP